MSGKQRWICFGVLGIAALAIGYLVGGNSSSGAGETLGQRTEAVSGADAAASAGEKPVEAADAAGFARAQMVAAGDVMGAVKEIAAIDGVGGQNRAWLEMVAALDVEGIERFANTYFGKFRKGEEAPEVVYPEHLDRGAFFAVFDRWVELDADGLLAMIKERTLAEDADRDHALEQVIGSSLGSFSQRCFAKAMAAFGPDGGIPPESAVGLRALLIGSVAQQDPLMALELAAKEEGEIGLYAVSMAMEVAGKHHEEILKVALAMEVDAEFKEEMVFGLFFNWNLSDPAAAAAAIAKIEDPDLRRGMIGANLEEWVKREPVAAVAFWQSLEPELRDTLTYRMMQDWAEYNPEGALRWALENAPGEVSNVFWGVGLYARPEKARELFGILSEEQQKQVPLAAGFLDDYAADDPLAVLVLLETNQTELKSPGELGNALGKALAERGPEAIAEALEAAPAGKIREEMLRAAFEYSAYDDPEKARLALRPLAGDERDLAMTAMVMGWAEKDPAAAASFAKAEGSGEVLNAAVVRWAAEDPAASYQWLVDTEENSAAAGVILTTSGLAKTWARAEPAAAAEAMQALPEPIAGKHLGEVVGVWFGEDPEAASGFIDENLQAGTLRDEVVVALVDAVKEDDRQAATEWAQTISDEGKKQSALDALATD